MLKKPTSVVLASLRGSTLKKTFRRSETLTGFIRSPRAILGVNGHTECGPYLLASSLAAALLNGLFEHPAMPRLNHYYGQLICGDKQRLKIVFPQPARYYPFQWIALSFFPWPPARNHRLWEGKLSGSRGCSQKDSLSHPDSASRRRPIIRRFVRRVFLHRNSGRPRCIPPEPNASGYFPTLTPSFETTASLNSRPRSLNRCAGRICRRPGCGR